MLPDARIRLSTTKIDFENDVGLASQDHDNYPPAQGQARFDHMRMFLIGLLANQASFDEPTQYRDGTAWFDLNTATLKIRRNDAWVPLAEAVLVADGVTLSDWYTATNNAIAASAPDVMYSGSCTENDTVLIKIPESLRAQLFSDSRPFVYINGILINPRHVVLEPGVNPTAVRLTTDTINAGDSFTVIVRRIPEESFYSSSVTIP